MCSLKAAFAWWSSLGLAFDLIGFLMIVWEWSTARAIVRLEKIPEELEREIGKEHVSRHLRESVLDRIEMQEGTRLPLVVLAVILIVLGFVLQIVGNWPCQN